jgi:basic membrane lipoprotein Med (substrate-binding protein (PBP1-ABC) superfamily)
MQRAAEDFGFETRAIESNTPTDFEPNIQTCLEGGFNAIVTVGFLLTDATLAAAEANPDVYFVGVDQFFDGQPDNLVGVQSREDQSGFLAGVMAGLMTKSNVVGGVYGINVPAVVKFRNGYEQGAKYANPDVETLGVYLDSFVDPASGALTAEDLIGQGADVIFGAGGGTGSGGIQFAASEGIPVIGVDQDEYFTTFGGGEAPGAEFLITSAQKAIDVCVYDMLAGLSGAEGAEWLGGSLCILSVDNDGIKLAPVHDADVPDDVLAAVDAARELLKSGELTTGVDPLTGELLDAAPADEASSDAGATKSIVDIASSDPRFTTLTTAVLSADPTLLLLVSGPGPVTVFAPTNEAFEASLAEMGMEMSDLTGDMLNDILRYHAVEGTVLLSDLEDGATLTTLNGADITVSVTDDGFVLNGTVNVIEADIQLSNGVIHVIDHVLVPPSE